uniref:Integrase zinc-binding domain-containing protein n=1 Tax=Peronospora matthiolae TaxID=2874970 RepID=A0AAV1V150_9STRA
MARWLSFFAEYNFTVEYKPGRLNVVADALSRRPDFETVAKPNSETVTVAVMTSSVPSTTLYDDVRRAYAQDGEIVKLLTHLSQPSRESLKRLSPAYRSASDRYTTRNGLLYYTAVSGDTPRVVIPDDTDLRLRIMFEYHDAPIGGHRGREKTYLTVSRDFYWPRQYQFVRNLYRFRLSAGNPSQWILSSGYPKTHAGIRVFSFLLTDSAKWYTLWLYQSQSQQVAVLVSLLTPSSDFMGCPVNSYQTEIHDSLLISGVPCSNHSERA